jgi:hypothetical protein
MLDWHNKKWNYRVPITIPANKIPGEITDCPLYFDLSLIDSSHFWENVQEGGADIRIVEENGVDWIPCEIVSCDKVSQTGEIYFLASSLTTNANATWYLYYGNAQATMPLPEDSLCGSMAVWKDYWCVIHLGNDNVRKYDAQEGLYYYCNSVNNNEFSLADYENNGDATVTENGVIGNASVTNVNYDWMPIEELAPLKSPFTFQVWSNSDIYEEREDRDITYEMLSSYELWLAFKGSSYPTDLILSVDGSRLLNSTTGNWTLPNDDGWKRIELCYVGGDHVALYVNGQLEHFNCTDIPAEDFDFGESLYVSSCYSSMSGGMG